MNSTVRVAAFCLTLSVLHALFPPLGATQEIEMGSPAVIRTVVNQPFQISFTPVEGPVPDEAIILPQLPAGIELADGLRTFRIFGQPMRATVQYRAVRPGRFIIEPIVVMTASGFPAESERTVVEAFAGPNDTLLPLQARWRVLQTPLVVGQSVPVLLELGPVDSFLYPDTVTVQTPRSGLFEEVSGLGAISTIRVGDRQFFYVPVAAFLFTSADSGTVAIPEARVAVANRTATAPALNVAVRPLPPAATRSGAVGIYRFSHSVPPTTVQPGQVVELTLTVEGVGNLPVLQLPQVETVGLTEIDRTEQNHFEVDSTTNWGYRGTRSLKIRYEASGEAREARIDIGSFEWFDPVLQSVRSVSGTGYAVALPERAEQDQAEIPTTLWSVEQLLSPYWIQWHRSWPVLALFVFGPLGRLMAFALRRRRAVRRAAVLSMIGAVAGLALLSAVPYVALNVERLNNAQRLIDENEPRLAEVLYELELQDHPYHAGLHHNRGVLALNRGDLSTAVFHLRRSARLAPELPQSRRVLEAVEQQHEIDAPHLPVGVRTDFLLGVLVIVWTALWWVAKLHAGPGRVITSVMLVLMLGVTGGAFFWSRSVAFAPEATVIESAVVRRIPDDRATPWLTLDAATSVEMVLAYQDYRLVRTRHGNEGWVHRLDLLVGP